MKTIKICFFIVLIQRNEKKKNLPFVNSLKQAANGGGKKSRFHCLFCVCLCGFVSKVKQTTSSRRSQTPSSGFCFVVVGLFGKLAGCCAVWYVCVFVCGNIQHPRRLHAAKKMRNKERRVGWSSHKWTTDNKAKSQLDPWKLFFCLLWLSLRFCEHYRMGIAQISRGALVVAFNLSETTPALVSSVSNKLAIMEG